MERGIVLNALSRSSASLGASRGLGGITHDNNLLRGTGVMRSSKRVNVNGKKRAPVVEVVAKGKKGMAGRMYKPRPPPSISKAEDDNPRFLLFIRTKKVPRWYPLSIVTGGTTAKIMVAAKDTPIGKSIYESTMTRNIAGVIYKDEEEIRKIAIKQYPVLKAASEFQYGYKLINPENPNSALYATDVVKIPPQEELKPVVEKVKDFFGNALSGVKESFGSISSLNIEPEEDAAAPEKENKSKAKTTS